MFGTLHVLQKKTIMGKAWHSGVGVAFADGFFFFKGGVATELRSSAAQSPSSPPSPSDASAAAVPTFVFINTAFGDDRFGNGSLSAPVMTRAAALKLSIVSEASGVVVAFEFDGTYQQICNWKASQWHIWPHPPKSDRGDVFVVTSSSTPMLPSTSHFFSAGSPGHCAAWVVGLAEFANKDSELAQLRSKFIHAAETLTASAAQEEALRSHISDLVQQNRNLCAQLEQQNEQLQNYSTILQEMYDASAQKEQERETALLEMAAAAYDRKAAAAIAAQERELRERLEQERTHEIVRVRAMGFGRCSADVKKGGSPLGQKVTRATAALSKNLFDHVGAISNRSISPGYKQTVVSSFRISFRHSTAMMIGFVFSKGLSCDVDLDISPVDKMQTGFIVGCYSDGRFLNGDGRLQRPSLAGEWKHDDIIKCVIDAPNRLARIARAGQTAKQAMHCFTIPQGHYVTVCVWLAGVGDAVAIEAVE